MASMQEEERIHAHISKHYAQLQLGFLSSYVFSQIIFEKERARLINDRENYQNYLWLPNAM